MQDFSPWQSIVKLMLSDTDTEGVSKKQRPMEPMLEHFAADGKTVSTNTVMTAFIAFITVVVGLLALAFFYWVYKKDKALLLGIVSAIVVVYSLEQVVMIETMKQFLNPAIYKIYLGTTLFITGIFTVTCGFSFYKYYTHQPTDSYYTKPTFQQPPPPEPIYNTQTTNEF